MARFDIYENLGSKKDYAPFLVDVQNNFLQPLDTRIVIPLVALNAHVNRPSEDVFPLIQVNGAPYYLFTPEIAAAPLARLKSVIGSANMADRAKIQNALDKVLGGY